MSSYVHGVINGIESTNWSSVPGSLRVDHPDPTTIVVHYHYVVDGISGAVYDRFEEWLEHALTRVQGNMRMLRWKLVDHQDGSGGGLEYGTLTFKR